MRKNNANELHKKKRQNGTNGLHVPQDDVSVSEGGPPLIHIFG